MRWSISHAHYYDGQAIRIMVEETNGSIYERGTDVVHHVRGLDAGRACPLRRGLPWLARDPLAPPAPPASPASSTLTVFQRAERRKVQNVFVEILRLRCLQTAGMILESRVVDDMSEPFKANMSPANVRMPVHARIEGCFGIVQMKRENLLQSDELVD